MQLTVADKLKILDRLKNGHKKEDIIKDFNIVQRTLLRVAKSETQIIQPFWSDSVASLENCQNRSG